MLTDALPVNDFVDFSTGLDKGFEDIKTKRLANYKAMQEIGKGFAEQGQTMSVEQWADASRSIMGNGAWLTSTAPTADTLNVLSQQQAAAAKNKAELLRREQLKANAEEKKMMEADAEARFLGGDDEFKADEYLREMYGEDRAALMRANLPLMRQNAMHKATTNGLEFGAKMFPTIDDAKEYIAANGTHLNDNEKKGMMIAAEGNQKRTELSLTKEAQTLGANGFIGDANDRISMQTTVQQAFPKATAAQVTEMTERYMKVAAAAAQSKQVADENKAMQAVRQSRNQNYGMEQAKKAELQQLEVDRKAKEAATFTSSHSSDIASQMQHVQKLESQTKKTDADRAIMAGLRTYYIPNIAEYEDAVRRNDKATVQRIHAESQTIADRARKASTLGQAVTGQYANVDQLLGFVNSSGIYNNKTDLQRLGKELRDHIAIANTAGKKYSGGNPYASGAVAGFIESGVRSMFPSTAAENPSGADVQATARAQAETIRRRFIESTASAVSEVRAIIEKNRGVSVSSEDLAAREKAMVASRVRQMMEGAGPRNVEAEMSMVMEIMQAAGPTPSFQKQETPVEAYIKAMDSSYNAMMTRSGSIPGAVQPNPRVAYPPF